MFFVYTVFS